MKTIEIEWQRERDFIVLPRCITSVFHMKIYASIYSDTYAFNIWINGGTIKMVEENGGAIKMVEENGRSINMVEEPLIYNGHP